MNNSPNCGYRLPRLPLPLRLAWCIVFGLALVVQVMIERNKPHDR